MTDCCVPTVDDISITPDVLFFGSVTVGDTSEPQSVVVKNNTKKVVRFSNIRIVGPFELVDEDTYPSSLIPGASFKVIVRFLPTDDGDTSGGVYIDTNRAQGILYIGLLGTGVGAEPAPVLTTSFKTLDDMLASEIQSVEAGRIWQAGKYRYQEASLDATDHDFTTSTGIKLYVLDWIVDAFQSIEQAITRSCEKGKLLKGEAGSTYYFNTGVTITDKPVNIDFTGCRLLRAAVGPAAGQAAILVVHDFHHLTYGTAPAVISMEYAEYNYYNGAIYVPRIEVSDPENYKVRDIVRVVSSDIIPCIEPWGLTRWGESGEVGAIEGNYVYLLRPWAENYGYNDLKITRMKEFPVHIRGGTWEDEGDPNPRFASMIGVRGAVRPVIEDVFVRDAASYGTVFSGCYEPISRRCRFQRLRMFNPNAFSYGVRMSGNCTRPVVSDPWSQGIRHCVDTGSGNITDTQLANGTAQIINFGGTVDMMVFNGVALDSVNAPFNDHPDAFRSRFYNCQSLWSNRRMPGSTIWGMQLRGRGSMVLGGFFESLVPLKLEPSTTTPYIIDGAHFYKTAINGADAQRDPAFDMTGNNIVGGGQGNVIFTDCVLKVSGGGVKEAIAPRNMRVEFGGRISYQTASPNPVVFLIDGNSEVILNDTVFDFRECTAAATATILTSMPSTGGAVMDAQGKVTIMGSTTGQTVLANFSTGANTAKFYEVRFEGSLFAGHGFNNFDSALAMFANIKRMDGLAQPSTNAINFSLPAEPKNVTWLAGRGEDTILIRLTASAAGMSIGSIPAGTFIGQKLILINVGVSSSIEISDITHIDVGATRTLSPGSNIIFVWNGTNWIG